MDEERWPPAHDGRGAHAGAAPLARDPRGHASIGSWRAPSTSTWRPISMRRGPRKSATIMEEVRPDTVADVRPRRDDRSRGSQETSSRWATEAFEAVAPARRPAATTRPRRPSGRRGLPESWSSSTSSCRGLHRSRRGRSWASISCLPTTSRDVKFDGDRGAREPGRRSPARVRARPDASRHRRARPSASPA